MINFKVGDVIKIKKSMSQCGSLNKGRIKYENQYEIVTIIKKEYLEKDLIVVQSLKAGYRETYYRYELDSSVLQDYPKYKYNAYVRRTMPW